MLWLLLHAISHTIKQKQEIRRANPYYTIRWMRPTQLRIELIGQLYLSGMSLDVAPMTNTEKTYVEKRLDYVLNIW